jgi:dipeptidyl aminopeptidase/acylaminoacyl peptidase
MSRVRIISTLFAFTVAVVVGSTPALAADEVTVEQWLRLGPVVDPLPVFHDAERGGYDLKARLEAEVFPSARLLVPREGERLTWHDGELAWSAVRASNGGAVELAPPDNAAGQPAAAWLATWLDAGRFRKVELELTGSGPRRAWLDGKQVASGGTGDEAGEVKAELELATGKHLLLVESLRPADAEGDWSVGARLNARDDLADAGLATTLDPSRGVTILDVLDATSVGSVAVSASGQYVAVVKNRTYPGTDKRESWIEVWALQLYRTWRGASNIGQIEWMPEGNKLTFVTREDAAEGEKARSTIWVWDLRTEQITPLVERIADLQGFRWSPDAKKLVYTTSVEPDKDERGIKRLESIRDRWANHRTKSYLHLVSIPSGITRRLTAGPITTGSPEFSPDGNRLLFTRSVEDLEARPFGRTELWELDLRSHEAKKLRDSRWLNAASYGPEGKRLLLFAAADEFGDAGVDVPAGAIANSYDGQLFIWDPAGDEADPITRDFDPSVRGAWWNADTGHIVLTAEDRDFVRLYLYDVGTREFQVLETGLDTFGRVGMSLRGPVVVGTGSSPWQPEKLVAVDLNRNMKNTMEQPSRERMRTVQPGAVEPWSFTSAAGKTIDGRVYLPPGFDAEKKYPCIVYYYGGTSPVSRTFGGRYPKEYWASQGYVVYVLQPSGATGFGQEFSAVHVNDWGKTSSEEIIEGTRKFLAAHPFVDPERVGCIGASYGGFMTMLLSTKTDVFAAAVAHAGISALSSYWGEGYWGYAYSAVATADSYPWNRRDVYVDQSPLFRADKNRVPILLTHGAADTNVPVGESDQFYIALKLLGKDVEYLQVAGQDHWILDHDKRVLWSQSIVAWFDRWLKDEPQWWEHLWPER